MAFIVDYNDNGEPTRIKVEPEFVDSSGTYNTKLGRIVLGFYRQSGQLNNWNWDGMYLSKAVSPGDNLESMYKKAQDGVLVAMDKVAEQLMWHSVISEYHKE